MRISDVILARALHVKCSLLIGLEFVHRRNEFVFCLIMLFSVGIEGLKDVFKDFTKRVDVSKTRV